jgi:pyruvate/2-oxoglutarate dehydrogenase complex dihydrolipoamide dehydrogenase (E3) component/uncharacterized membrane protein YdjX (TVP38/TMEM64 family)
VKNKFKIKLGLIVLVGLLVVLFFYFDLGRYFSLSSLKERLDTFESYYSAHRLMTMALYMGIYILVAALSLPGAAILTLAGGAIFGLFYGLLLVSFASTIGATLAFLFSRYLFKDWVQTKFSVKLETINQGIEKEGGFYLFTLRLVPVFPFFVINLVMGLAPIKTSVFYLVSQVGMLPGTIVFVNAGTQLAKLESVSGILSPGLLFSFALLGVFPIIARRLTDGIRKKKMYSRFNKPARFDYNMVVIGGGSAGLVAAYIASAVKARVALIEASKMGGDCLNTGCVPSKALIASAKLMAHVNQAQKWGFEKGHLTFDFSSIMERVQSKIKQIEPHDSIERYTQLGVDCYTGYARIRSPFEVQVNDQVLTTKNIIVATGGRPFIPPIPGLDQAGYLTSDTIWEIRNAPRRMVVLGGGPIGCEMAQAFARLGVHVTQVQRGKQIMEREDPDAAMLIQAQFKKEGIELLLEHTAEKIEVRGKEKVLICRHNDQTVQIPFDTILVALGRVPNTEGFGLKEIGVTLGARNAIQANDFLQTNFPNIYCSGDVHGRYQFTHTAAHESWYASVNALFGRFKRFRVDYSIIPWTTFVDPEVARVGLNEKEAQKTDVAYETVKYGLDDLDRAIADSHDHGFVKVLTVPGKDKILGVTIVGNHASDLLAEFVLAMKHGIGLNKILGTIHTYPTMSEANKYAAGLWKKAHAPERLLQWVEKYHKWNRGGKSF